jgi:hydroxyethylthiazole kinase
MNEYAKSAGEALDKIRETRPLVHSITNYVVMNSTANALLAMGAAPIMAHAPEEMDELAQFPGVLVINIGTLSREWIDSMLKAAKLAGERKKPWVLDPVGAGATSLRTETAGKLLETARPTVIRANASETLALANAQSKTRGVDSVNSVEESMEAARALASGNNTVVAVTGETDYITDGARSLFVYGGHSMLTNVTGTGCAASVIVAAFLAVEDDALMAAAHGLAFFGMAAAKAGLETDWPGSFWVKTLDQLYALTPAQVGASARIEEA